MFECTETGQFTDVARPMGCDAIEDSRGVAIADLNDDGLLDVVINNNNAEPAIYLNRMADAGNWLRVQLVGAAGCNRNAIGARVQIVINTGGKSRTLTRWVEAGTGYAAQSDIRLHFGLSDAKWVESMQVSWPDGRCQEFVRSELTGRINTTIRVEQGRPLVNSAFPVAVDVPSRKANRGIR